MLRQIGATVATHRHQFAPAQSPVSGAKVYADDALVGFGVRVSFHGTASFVLTYGVALKRVTIGRVGVISLKDA